jgi:hypothetical protein
MSAYTFTGAVARVDAVGRGAGVAASTAGAALVPLAGGVAAACRDVVDVHAPSSPDPPAAAASAVSALLRVRTAAAG